MTRDRTPWPTEDSAGNSLKHTEVCAWRCGGECDCADAEWQVVHTPTGNVVTVYDSKQEAEAAVAWHAETYGAIGNLEVRRG